MHREQAIEAAAGGALARKDPCTRPPRRTVGAGPCDQMIRDGISSIVGRPVGDTARRRRSGAVQDAGARREDLPFRYPAPQGKPGGSTVTTAEFDPRHLCLLRNGCDRASRPWLSRTMLALLGIASLLAAWAPALRAQESAEAAQLPPLTIAIFMSSRKDLCYDPGDVAAIRTLTRLEQERVNQQGGVAGRQIRLRFVDDERDPAKTIAGIRSAIADPTTLAMIGLSNANRAKAALDALGVEVRNSAIPFISNISVNSIFEDFPNIFTTQASQEDERLPVMVRFIQHLRFARPAFVGLGDAVFSTTLGDGLKRMLGEGALVSDHRLATMGEALEARGVAAAIGELKQKQPDLLVLAIGPSRAAGVIKDMMAAGVTPALFITGRIESLPAEITGAYPNAIYQLAWDRLPEAYNDRLRKRIARTGGASWVFEGAKVPQAPGWASGECKPRSEEDVPDPLDSANLRAIGIGTQYADMVALVTAAARTAGPGSDVSRLRKRILQQLASTYAAGRGAFKGTFENWMFNPESRAAIRTPFVVILPRGLGRTQLAPVQFVRVNDGALRRIDTLYVDIDLVRAHRVDDNEKTFFAEFYLSMRSNGSASIELLDFTNAYLDPRTNGRQITVEMLHDGGESDAYPEGMKVYRVSGRFVFEPDVASYPFDTQRFSIDLQPKRGDAPFIVQPPPLQLRDQQVATDGWDAKAQYVGYDQDFVPLVDAFTHAPSVVPFYKASFVWLMKRQTTDYYLRVVVPLAFILIIAYLSIFIPQVHFEAIVTIQVTALLSAVALYLALPKLDSDTATLSDRIFVFDYMLVSLMIVVSILRASRFVACREWLKAMLGFVHVVAIPAMVAAMAFYIHGLSVADQ